MMKRNKSQGSWLAIGIGVGVSIGVAIKNIGAGIAIGVAFGLVMGKLAARKNEKIEKIKNSEDGL
jgi:hypothetical protein